MLTASQRSLSPRVLHVPDEEASNDAKRPWTREDNEQSRVLLSQCLYSSDLPFQFTESPSFQKFCASLNPDFVPPTRQSMGEGYLKKEHDRLEETILKRLKNTQVTLVPDGSTDGCQEPITHIMALDYDNLPFLLKVINHGTEEHTSEHLVTHIVECIRWLEERQIGVKGIISDNESKMRKFRQILREKYQAGEIVSQMRAYPFFAIPGDPPHGLQLILKDIFKDPTVALFLTNAQFISEKFKNTRLRSFLKEKLSNDKIVTPKQRVGHSLGVITRWGSHLNMLQKLFTRRPQIVSVMATPQAVNYIHEDLESKMSGDFWLRLGDFLNLVKPIADTLKRLEGDGCIGVVLKEFYALDVAYAANVATLTTFFATVVPKIVISLKKRWDLITDDVFAASFVVDPRWRDIVIVEADWLDAERVIRAMAGDNWDSIRPQFLRFRTKQGPLFSEVVSAKEDPTLLWQSARNINTFKPLAEIALYLLTFPMSGVSVERSFSVVRHIHTWKRNKLAPENLAKLTSVRINKGWEEKSLFKY